jgi:TatD DNase family protein
VIDSHCHLADDAFEKDLPEVAARAQAAGVSHALCILSADEPDEVARAEVVSRAWPTVSFAAAVHPHRAAPYAERVGDAVTATRTAARRTAAVALGEMGLDYHYDFAPRDVQQDVFAAQVALAIELGLPVVIHTREAADDTVPILRQAGEGRVRGVMHCFTGTLDEARQALELGFHISFSGIVTFPKSESLREVGRFVPQDRLLVETDAPFLAPIPHRGKRNEPAWVQQTVAALAAARGIDTEALSQRLTENFHQLFGVSRATQPLTSR